MCAFFMMYVIYSYGNEVSRALCRVIRYTRLTGPVLYYGMDVGFCVRATRRSSLSPW